MATTPRGKNRGKAYIAEIMGVSEKAVESLLQRAKQGLDKKLSARVPFFQGSTEPKVGKKV